MDKSKELLKNTFIIAIGRIFTQFISFLLLPVYTSLLSTTEYGLVDLLSTLVSIFVPLIALQIEQAVFRYLIESREDEVIKTRIISSSFYFLMMVILIYTGAFMIISSFIDNQYKYFLLFNVVICIFCNLLLEISRGLGKNQHYAIAGLIAAVSTILLNILFVVILRIGAYGILISNFFGNFFAVIYLFLFLKLYRYIKISQANRYRVKNLLLYSLPLVPNSISWWVINSSDRILISFILGAAHNGIYSAAFKFPLVYITLYNVFNITWTESVALHINEKDGETFFLKTLDKCIRLFAGLMLGIVSLMPFIFKLLINEKFNQAYYQIPLLMIASFLNVLIGLISTLYIAKKLTTEVAKTSVIAAIIHIVITLILINQIGLYAASLSTIIAYGSMLSYRLINIYKLFKIKLDLRIVLAILGCYLITLYSYYSLNTLFQIINLAGVIVFCFYINKSSIIGISGIIIIKLRKHIHEWYIINHHTGL